MCQDMEINLDLHYISLLLLLAYNLSRGSTGLLVLTNCHLLLKMRHDSGTVLYWWE